jgi:hypothetical protein
MVSLILPTARMQKRIKARNTKVNFYTSHCKKVKENLKEKHKGYLLYLLLQEGKRESKRDTQRLSFILPI